MPRRQVLLRPHLKGFRIPQQQRLVARTLLGLYLVCTWSVRVGFQGGMEARVGEIAPEQPTPKKSILPHVQLLLFSVEMLKCTSR